MSSSITSVPGIEVGHYTDLAGGTGCSVVICRKGAVSGVDVRGGAPGTHETDVLRPGNLVQRTHAVLLTGGSSFGLAATSGVMRYLEEQGIGFPMGPVRVPVVSGAVIYDLSMVTSRVRPGPEEGYMACQNASSDTVEEGAVGAGTGATVGKALGISWAIKSGIGTASVALGRGIVVGALVSVNAYGGVVDHTTGQLVAGPRLRGQMGMANTVDILLRGQHRNPPVAAPSNTTIGVVATNASLTKEQANYLARVSHDGMALTIRPCHTIRDGDTMFAMATSTVRSIADMTQLGTAAVDVVAQAVLRAVAKARGLGGLPSASELESE